MAVLSYREVLPRTFDHKFGEAPTAERKFTVSLDGATPNQQILNAVGIFFGANHPEYTYLRCVQGSVNENDRYYAECTYRYELPPRGTEEFDPNPLFRRDVWSFSVGGAQVPALFYYHGEGNGDVRPLTNAAGDFFEGLTATECEVRATISSNRPTFDLLLASNVTNGLNASPYLGGDQYTWLCAGIGAQQTSEVVNDIEVRYWQLTVELLYRRSGWVMQLPHVGWHYIDSGSGNKKVRAWVYQDQDGTQEKVDASSPQPLDENGGLKYPGSSGFPDILKRRVHPVIDFPTFFGTPPL